MPKSQCQMMSKMVYLPASLQPLNDGRHTCNGFFGQHGTQMAIVSIDADIKAKWPQGQCSYSPGSPEELAIIAIDLLFKALGTAGAQAFVSQVFEKYPHDHSAAK